MGLNMDDVKVYKGKDKVNMLYQQLKRADNWGTVKDVYYMRGIYGHCAANLDDFDDLSYIFVAKTYRLACGMKAAFLLLDNYIE